MVSHAARAISERIDQLRRRKDEANRSIHDLINTKQKLKSDMHRVEFVAAKHSSIPNVSNRAMILNRDFKRLHDDQRQIKTTDQKLAQLKHQLHDIENQIRICNQWIGQAENGDEKQQQEALRRALAG